MRLVIAGGGPGGHLFPGIAIAEALLERDPHAAVLFVGTERGIEARAVPKAGFDVKFIQVGGLKGKGMAARAKTLLQLPLAGRDARRILLDFKADVVVGVGGYASGPVVAAARWLGLPTAICEQNSVPGITNRLLARIVDRIFLTFEGSRTYFPQEKCTTLGNPVRSAFRERAKQARPAVDTSLVFTFGGSQGAKPLNEIVPQALGLLRARGMALHAMHQAGAGADVVVRDAYKKAGVDADVTGFIDDMVSVYQKACVTICRAGATSCAEITALGVPSILVPFPQATDDHQTKNAKELADAGACVLLPQSEMTPERLADLVAPLLTDAAQRERMAAAAQKLGRVDAAVDVVNACFAICKNKEMTAGATP